MALPFRSIFGLADESGNQFDPAFASGDQDRASRMVTGPAEMIGRDSMFTVEAESLAESIPVELRSGVTTHSTRVTLRLDDAEWEPGDTEVSTRLMQVYRACPQLFTVAIDEAVDMPVTLRLAGVGEAAVAAPLPPVGSGGGTPFQALPSGVAMAQAPMSPFSSPLVKPIELPTGPPPLPATVNSPFKVAPSVPAKESASPISPFLAAITGTVVSPANKPEPPLGDQGVVNDLRLSFPFHVLLGQIEPSMLGINPAALPLDWRTHLPWSFVKPQFIGGRVVASLAKLVEHADAAAKVGLQGVNGAIEVSIPLKEIVRQLPQSEVSSGAGAITAEERAAVNPFKSQAQEEALRGFIPLKEAPPALLDPTAPVLSPFRIAPDAKTVDRREVELAAPMSFGKGLDSLDELSGPSSEGSKKPGTMNAFAPPVPATFPQTPAGEAVGSFTSLQAISGPVAPPAQAVAPLMPSMPSGAERSLLRFDGVGVQPMVQDLELRAVFCRAEPFTRQLAIDLTAGLPGVLGCCLFTVPQPVEVLAKSEANSAEVAAMVTRMPRMYERIQGLAEDLGFESGETFTLRTSQGIVSFISHGQVCLGVLQEGEKGDAGLWARLVLIARGLAALRE